MPDKVSLEASWLGGFPAGLIQIRAQLSDVRCVVNGRGSFFGGKTRSGFTAQAHAVAQT
jgi:hypothetical protein